MAIVTTEYLDLELVTDYAETSFDPSSLPGLIRWGKPEAMGLSDGQAAASLTDFSGAGHAYGAVSTSPHYSAAGINGVGALRFNGSSDQASSSAIAAALAGGGVPFFLGVVFRPDALINAHQCLWIMANVVTTDPTNATRDLYLRSESNSYEADLRDNAGNEYLLRAGTSTAAPTILGLNYHGSSADLWLNGVKILSYPAGTGALTGPSLAATLGNHRRADIANPAWFAGLIGQDLITQPDLTDGDVAQLMSYWQNLYAISGTLAWEPYMLYASGLQGWWRGDSALLKADGTSVGNGGTLDSWWGKASVNYNIGSPANRDFLAGIMATLLLSGINGKPSTVWDGATMYADCPQLAPYLAGANTPFGLAVIEQATALTGGPIFNGYAQGDSGTTVIELLEQATPQWNALRRDTGGHLVNITGGTPDLAPRLKVFNYNGTHATLIVSGGPTTVWNNVQLDTTTAGGNNTLTAVNHFLTGGYPLGGNYWAGKKSEIIFCSQPITGADLANLQAYATAYYGIAL